MKSSKNFFPQTAPTDEYNEISKLNVLGVSDQRALESLEKATQNQRRSAKNPSMVKLVSLGFLFL